MKKIFNVLVVLCAVFAVCALMACKQPTGPATVTGWENTNPPIPATVKYKIPWDDTTTESVGASTFKYEVEFYDDGTLTTFITFKTTIHPGDEDEEWEETWKLAGEYDGNAEEDGDIKIKMLDTFERGSDMYDVSKWKTQEIADPKYDPTPAHISGDTLTYNGITFKKR